jgi:hypothetical protein
MHFPDRDLIKAHKDIVRLKRPYCIRLKITPLLPVSYLLPESSGILDKLFKTFMTINDVLRCTTPIFRSRTWLDRRPRESRKADNGTGVFEESKVVLERGDLGSCRDLLILYVHQAKRA